VTHYYSIAQTLTRRLFQEEHDLGLETKMGPAETTTGGLQVTALITSATANSKKKQRLKSIIQISIRRS
jgi:hypothetical protein